MEVCDEFIVQQSCFESDRLCDDNISPLTDTSPREQLVLAWTVVELCNLIMPGLQTQVITSHVGCD